MTATIHSIRALQPGEKLIIKLGDNVTPERIEQIAIITEAFLSSDSLRVMIVESDMEVYVLKDGDEVLLKDELNKEAQ